MPTPTPTPTAWEPNGPPGVQMGLGGGGTHVSQTVDSSLNVSSWALQVEVHVAAHADADRVGIIVRDTTNRAFQQFIDQMQRQLGKRIRVRI